MPRREALTILFTDGSLVAIDKPARLATIPGRGETTSALEQLAEQLSLPHTGTDDPRVRVVHRLDKETSGVLLFARTVEAQRIISHQFQNNTVAKEYLALVAGNPRETAGEIDAPLAPHPTSPKRMSVTRRGRPARTSWRVEEQFRGFALLRCFPKTGKTHQIRVHLAHIGAPLAVDPLYNPNAPPALMLSSFKRGYQKTRGEEERPLIARLTLHAHRLCVRHPGGSELQLEAPLPKDFRAMLNMLRKYAR